jgi:hypothetical protein
VTFLDSAHRTQKRFRLPGIDQLGYAQLSIIETALWPLGPGQLSRNVFETGFSYTNKDGRRERATVEIAAHQALKPNDDYVLWALLSLTLRFSQSNILTATPYWFLRQLGMPTGGHNYLLLRESVERLARVMYHCSAFYNPLSQEHERWTFSFYSSHLPTSLDTDRLWKLVWNEPFIQISRATGGRLMFDLELFHKLGSPATRRLFLKLTDRFYRTNRVHLDVDDLTINGLGYASSVPLKARKQKLTQCIETLREHGVLMLGRGQSSPKELFLKRGKGSYVVVLYRGPYYERPIASLATKENLKNDPLYEPMHGLGIDEPMIRKLLCNCQRGVLERWLRITEAAVKDKPRGFPGFKVSPAAFFVDGVLNDRTPPDWMYQLEKAQRQRRYEAESAKMKVAEQLLREQYKQQRQEGLKLFLKGDSGRSLYKMAYDARLAWHKAQGYHDDIANQRANDEALEWIERGEEFAFPEFAIWTLAQPNLDN